MILLVALGVTAAIVVAVIVVYSFAQGQNDRANIKAAFEQSEAEEICRDTQHFRESIAKPEDHFNYFKEYNLCLSSGMGKVLATAGQ